jgi:hypothetical protein
MSIKLFDLNVEEVLEHWEVHHGIRELIANALDEQLLTGTRDIEISKDAEGVWHVRDFGRGLRIEHLTLNENEEKLSAVGGVIGKFGVGLKDALATFHRRGIDIEILSRHGVFRLRQASKHGFDTISTLHVEFETPLAPIQGTDIRLKGVTDGEMAKAKALFLRFDQEQVLESTPYGEIIYQPTSGACSVYINGVLANEEANFLFSYNIISLTEGMKKRLNRERLNVGRTIYADRVKAILRAAKSDRVKELLAEEVRRRADGGQADELQWIEISQLALNYLQEQDDVAYITEDEIHAHPDILDHMRRDGVEVILVTEQQKTKLSDQIESGGPFVRTLETFVQEFNATFQYNFIEPDVLTPAERDVHALAPRLLSLVAQPTDKIPPIRISETIRISTDDTNGVWDKELQAIVIKRTQLRSPVSFAGTLLHEFAHAITGYVDATRAFESVLTTFLGRTAAVAIDKAMAMHT